MLMEAVFLLRKLVYPLDSESYYIFYFIFGWGTFTQEIRSVSTVRSTLVHFESAVIAQNDECKAGLIARLHVCETSEISQETQYLTSKLTDKLLRYNCRNINCAPGKRSSHSR